MFVKNTKPAIGHIWLLVVSLSINILSLVSTIYFASKYSQLSQLGWRAYFFPFIFVVGVLSEIIIYWNIRFQVRIKAKAWLHCALVCIAFLLPPTVNIVVAYWADNFGIKDYQKVFMAINAGGPYFFWFCMIAGHFFFYNVLVDIKSRSLAKNEEMNEGDLLSDFNV